VEAALPATEARRRGSTAGRPGRGWTAGGLATGGRGGLGRAGSPAGVDGRRAERQPLDEVGGGDGGGGGLLEKEAQ
jgi:hypothetical protein